MQLWQNLTSASINTVCTFDQPLNDATSLSWHLHFLRHRQEIYGQEDCCMVRDASTNVTCCHWNWNGAYMWCSYNDNYSNSSNSNSNSSVSTWGGNDECMGTTTTPPPTTSMPSKRSSHQTQIRTILVSKKKKLLKTNPLHHQYFGLQTNDPGRGPSTGSMVPHQCTFPLEVGREPTSTIIRVNFMTPY